MAEIRFAEQRDIKKILKILKDIDNQYVEYAPQIFYPNRTKFTDK